MATSQRGIYLIAAGSSSQNRKKSLERAIRVADVARFLSEARNGIAPPYQAKDSVFAWGANKLGDLDRLAPGDFVVDVKNYEVPQIFEMAKFLDAPRVWLQTRDTRLQEFIGWDAEKSAEVRRPYPFVYFLTNPQRPRGRNKAFFQKAFGQDSNQNWLVRQRWFSPAEVNKALERTRTRSIEEFLGISSRPLALSERSEAPPPPRTTEEPPAPKLRGQGYGLTGPERLAVEQIAMRDATKFFQGLGYKVEDVSATQSYDLRCISLNHLRYVEVKGTTGSGASVLLTRNEVDFARVNRADMVLFVLHDIALDRRTAPPTASGGVQLVLSPWNVDAGTLVAETYRHTLPVQSPP